MILTARQRSAALVMAANISLSTAFSPNALGMIFSRRLKEQAFKQIRRSCRPAMGDGQPQMGDHCFEVILEACHGRGQAGVIVPDQAGGKIAGDGPARRLVGGLSAGLEVGPDVLEHLGGQVPHAMG